MRESGLTIEKKVRTMQEQEHPDTKRLRILAGRMSRMWGRREQAGYVFPCMMKPIVSTREECLLDDLRIGIDKMATEDDNG